MKKKTKKILFIFQITVQVFLILSCSSFALAGLSKNQEAKLNELVNLSNPITPIFGKISEPLKASVILNLDREEPSTKNTIKLPIEEDKGTLSELEQRRKELQKVEEEGLNFIQPSLALTEEEQKSIDEFFSRNEQEQLLILWKAAIERNKTIQFIIQKLTPQDSPQKANSVLSKTIGAAIFLPFYALQALSDSAGAYVGSQVGGRVLGSVIEGKMQKNQAQMQLSQTESIILFMMIDEVAERLRQRYHAYKRLMVERALATNELEEVKKDNLDAQESNTPGAGIIANLQRRQVEREVRRIDSEIRSQRNALVELSGLEAVASLDEQLKIELAATTNTPLDFLGVENK